MHSKKTIFLSLMAGWVFVFSVDGFLRALWSVGVRNAPRPLRFLYRTASSGRTLALCVLVLLNAILFSGLLAKGTASKKPHKA
jgi:hypothetical protein